MPRAKKEKNTNDEEKAPKKEKDPFWEMINDISATKKGPFISELYSPFNVNRAFSIYLDTVLYAQEMNQRYMLDKDMQYQYLIQSIRPRKRFSPWIKRQKSEDVDAIAEYYGYSPRRAAAELKMHDEFDLEYIKERLEKGGGGAK